MGMLEYKEDKGNSEFRSVGIGALMEIAAFIDEAESATIQYMTRHIYLYTPQH